MRSESLLLISGFGLVPRARYHYFFAGIKYYVKGLIAILITTAGFLSMLHVITSIALKE